MSAVYVQTNDAADNEAVAFRRSDDGALAPLGRWSTGGRGSGEPHLPSQGSVVLDDEGRWLLVVNAGSDELSVFAVRPRGCAWPAVSARGGARRRAWPCAGTWSTCSTTGRPTCAAFDLTTAR